MSAESSCVLVRKKASFWESEWAIDVSQSVMGSEARIPLETRTAYSGVGSPLFSADAARNSIEGEREKKKRSEEANKRWGEVGWVWWLK